MSTIRIAGTTEEPAARLVHELLDGWGWSPLWEESAPGRPNVVARRRGALPGERHLIVEGHTDVVTPGDPARWTHPPFAGVLADGKLHGRGTADMKAGLAAGLFAVRAIERAGMPFAGTITLAVVADEEGLMTGIKDFVARGHADGATAALVCEPEGGRVCIAQKGVLRCRVVARGRMAHGAMPESGANPVAALVDFLRRCGDLERAIQVDCGEHPYLGKFYLTPTVLAAGEAAQVNVIPGEAVAYLDIRTTPLTPHGLVLRSAPGNGTRGGGNLSWSHAGARLLRGSPADRHRPGRAAGRCRRRGARGGVWRGAALRRRPRLDRWDDPLARAAHPDCRLRSWRRDDSPPGG